MVTVIVLVVLRQRVVEDVGWGVVVVVVVKVTSQTMAGAIWPMAVGG